MIVAERWPSGRRAGEWYWYVHNDVTGQITRGYAADEWLARASIRVAIKTQTPEKP